MDVFIGIIVVLVCIELYWSPRIDKVDDTYILWYTHYEKDSEYRKYIKLL